MTEQQWSSLIHFLSREPEQQVFSAPTPRSSSSVVLRRLVGEQDTQGPLSKTEGLHSVTYLL